MTVSVSLNALAITGTDSNGVHWHVAEVDGWDGENVRTELLTAPGVAGGFPGEWVIDSKRLSVRGSFDAPSTAAMLVALEALMAAVAAGISADVALIVNRGSGAQSMQVRQADKPMVRILTDVAVQYEVQLMAPNPTKTSIATPGGPYTWATIPGTWAAQTATWATV